MACNTAVPSTSTNLHSQQPPEADPPPDLAKTSNGCAMCPWREESRMKGLTTCQERLARVPPVAS